MTSWLSQQSITQPLVTLFSVWVGYRLKVSSDKKTSLQNHISEAKEEIDNLSAACLEYWSRDVSSSERSGQDLQDECKIKSYNHNINKIINVLESHFRSNDYTNIRETITKLRQASSGGDFETEKDREASPEAIMETMRICGELKIEIDTSLAKKKSFFGIINLP